MKTSKKVLSLILVVFMLFSAFPLQGVAAEVATLSQFNGNARLAGQNYCSTAAAEWAKAHWEDFDSKLLGTGYWYDGGDCANFVSQCLYMGGIDMSTYWNTNGYKCHWTEPHGNQYAGSYVRCVQLYNFLVMIGAQVIRNPKASDVSIGDVILYNNPSIGRLGHSAIVIDIKNGEPVVAAHSVNGVRYRSDFPYREWHLDFSGADTYLMKLNGSTCVNYNPRNFDVYTASSGDIKLYRSTSTSSGYYTRFLSGEYAHVYKKSADGQWGYTFRYGNWGWIRLSNFTYRYHFESAPVSHFFGDWYTVQAANCKQDGVDKRVCQRCGYTETKTTKGGHIIDPKATCLDPGYCKICGEQCEVALGHNWDAGTITTQPTCLETGIRTYGCKRDSSHTYTEVVPALGHDYEVTATAPTCTAHGETIYKCTRCPDSYAKFNPDDAWSDWTADATLASQLSSDKIQTKTQYRYYTKETTTSYETSLSGYTQDGGTWKKSATNSFNYASFPSGFDQNHSIYKNFHKSCDVSAYENTTTKREVSSPAWAGYVYWHWMYDTNSANGTSGRAIYNQYGYGPDTGYLYKYFGAFTSTNGSYSSSKTYCNSLNITNYIIPERTAYSECQGATRWFRFDYYSVTYTDYKKLFNYWRWSTSPSAWQDTAITATSDRKVETRTLYKYDLSALGHDWADSDKVQICKCGTNESSTYCYSVGQYCKRCNLTHPEATKYEHSWGEWYKYSEDSNVTIYKRDCKNANCDCYELKSENNCKWTKTVVAPTCTTDGYTLNICSVHGEETKTDIIPALGHNIPAGDEGVLKVAATCTQRGEIWHYCERFDDGKTCSHYEIEYIEPFGHTMTKFDAVSATCTEDGNSEYYQCDLCKKYYSDKDGKNEIKQDSWIIPAHGHVSTDSVEWEIVSENGCGKTGWKQKLCDREIDGTVCGTVIDEEEIPEITPDMQIVDHNEYAVYVDGEWVPTSCEHDGIIYMTCMNCYETEHAHSRLPEVVLEPINIGRLDHVSSDWIIDEETVCIYPGHQHKECTRCGTILEEEIIEAKYTQHLLAEVQYGDGCIDKDCVRCDYFEAGTHNFQRDHLRDVAPTCTERGLEATTCSICGKYNDTELDELGHDHKLSKTTDPTCLTAGYDVYICVREVNGKVCGDTYETNSVSPLGHDMGEWYVAKEATCLEDGYKQKDCNRCDYYETIVIKQIGHDWDDGVIDPSSTCKEHGVKTYTCQNDSSHTYTDVVDLDPDNHVGDTYIKDDKEATCTEDGYTGDTYCSDCHVKLQNGEVIPAIGHDWDEWTTVTDATCEDDGLEQRICKNDPSHIEENVLDAIGHDWDEGVIIVVPTCKDYGTKRYTCQNDNSHINDKILMSLDPENHVGVTYIKDAKEATCTEDGYTGDTYCNGCDAKIEDGEVIPAFGHDWDEWTTVTEATCEENGLEKRVCKNDANHIEENVIEATGHDWDDGVVDPSSTCKDPGVKTYTCQNDGSHKKTEAVDVNPENHVGGTYILDATEPTCEKEGYTGDTYCSGCNVKLQDGEVISAHGHDWGEWETVTAPTCEETGLEKRVCNHDASHIEENVLDAIGHDWDNGVITDESTCKDQGTKTYTCQNDSTHTYNEEVALNPDNHVGETYIKDAKDATCTVDGYTGDTYCSDCNVKIKDGEAIPAIGHDWGEWATTADPTCETDGEKQRICNNDNSHIETDTLPATGHTPVNNPSVEPTCTEDGYTGDTVCSVCDKVVEEGTVVPKTGHAYGEWTVETAATCTEKGLEKRVCANDASHIETRETEALEHDMGEWYVYTAPTIDSKGTERRDCKRDGCDYFEEHELGVLPSYIITFIVPDTDGSYVYNGENYRVVEVKKYPSNVTKVTVPDVPELSGYIGYWEDFEPDGTDLVVKAKYELKSSDNESELKSDKDVVYKDGVATITLSACADTLNAKVPMGATPCDVILVLDQSNSMISNKIGTKTRLQVLQGVATTFIKKVYDSAVENNVDHRIAIAGFSGAGPDYKATGMLTPTGKLFNYGNKPDYSKAFVDVRDSFNLLNNAIAGITTGNGTSAELGMDMAEQIIANNNDGRKKIVIFITDGEPTRLSVSYGFSEAVANEAIQKANVIKNVYGAEIYSIGVASGADPADETKKFNKFLHYVSSNYPDALELTNSGQPALYKNYFLNADDSDELEKIFNGIVAQQITNTITFNKVSFYDTVSEYFTLTIENENALRESVKAEYGVTDEDITITRNADGTTTIKINNLSPKSVYNESNIQTGYGVTVVFDVTANKKTLDGGTFVTNTKDAGVQSGGVTVIDFKVPEGEKISSGRAIVEFRIGDEVYAIQEVEIGDKIVPPETGMAEWIVTDDTTVTKDYTVISTEYSSETRTITWYIDGEKVVDTYHIGEIVAVPEVPSVNNKIFVGWDTVVPYRMPDSNLVITAQYEEHTHNYEQTGYEGDCLTGVTTTYTCDCGDSYTETIKHDEHTFTAYVQKDENESVATMVCTVCGEKISKTINYEAVYKKETSYGYWPGSFSKTLYLDLTLYNNEGISIQPDGYIYVKFPPENADLFEDAQNGTMIIRRVNEDGTVDEIRKLSKPDENKVGYYVDGTYIVLKLDHFSYYVLTAEDETSTIPTYGQVECAFEGHDYKMESVDSTCVEGGYVKCVCSLCGDSYTEGETEANGHNYEPVVTAPTCTSDGYTTYTCSVCGDSYVDDSVEKTGHSYSETVVEPTCTTAGYTTFTCTVCGDTYVGNNVAAKGHNLEAKVVESGCTSGGYTVHECTECDYSYTDSTTAETGHNYVQTVVAATCTATGYTVYECSACGYSYTGDETPLATHTPGEWTLTPDGEYVKMCTVCNAVVETKDAAISIDGVANGKSSMTVYYKMSKPLDVSANGAKIIYTSANPGIASVSADGRVTGVKKGTTIITATIEGTNESVTCEVTVKYTWWQQIIRIALLGFLWY